jgi:hypothetical protein
VALRVVLAVVVVLALAGGAWWLLRDQESHETYSEQGVTVSYPSGWSRTAFSTTNDPHRLAVASYPLSAGSVEGDCGGIEAVERLPDDGALVLVIDYGDGPGFDPRPDPLDLGSGELANYDCFGESTAFRFRVGEHDLQAHLAFGQDATEETKEQALDVLRSIEVSS